MDEWTRHLKLNELTDYYTEPVRIQCSFKGNPAPLDYWTKNKEKIMKKAEEKYGNTDIEALRETMYSDIRLCNNFKISVALSILNYFKAERWLDISAGWGDRLIAAAIYGVKEYVAADPNLTLHPYYRRIIRDLVPKEQRDRYTIYKTGFEDIAVPDNHFDIVFSSPPFFDLEVYSKHEDDTLIKYANMDGKVTEQSWISKFFIPSLEKCVRALKTDGHMILYMGGSDKIMKTMLDTLRDAGLKHKGIIYFYSGQLRGMHVWKKET